MNVIVSNKQKNIIDSANIDAIKDLNGLFDIDELINNFKGYFFSKMIIDATSIVYFAKESVLRKLVNGIGAEKIYLLLPPKPEPPKKFCDFLVSLGIYNYSTNIEDILKFLRVPNTIDNEESNFYNNNTNENIYENNNSTSNDMMINNADIVNSVPVSEVVNDVNQDKKIVIGFKNVTLHAGSTTLIYLIKQQLEKKYKMQVDALEIGTGEFKYFNSNNMLDINPNSIELSINNSKSSIILIDLPNDNYNSLCDDIIYLVEPSIIKINKLLHEQSDIFTKLSNKKVVLNKSMLNNEDVSIFSKEAGINIYFNIPFVNDRIEHPSIDDFINKLGIVNSGGHGLFGLFK